MATNAILTWFMKAEYMNMQIFGRKYLSAMRHTYPARNFICMYIH